MNFKDIIEYIPQRPPFVMVDKLVEVNDTIAKTSFEISADNLFTEDNLFYEGGLIENMAQTTAAGSGYRGSQLGGSPKIGVIASIRKLSIIERPKVGTTLTTIAEQISEFGNAVVVSAKVIDGEKTIASCQMNVFILDDPNTLNA